MHSRSSYGERNMRNSIQVKASGNAVAMLKAKIKGITDSRTAFDHSDEFFDVTSEEFRFPNSFRGTTVHRVYLRDSRYKTGWVVDGDLSKCMLCFKSFGWLSARLKHHCRACGNLLCHECTPYMTEIAFTDEAKSKVCNNCFGLRGSVHVSSMIPTQPPPTTASQLISQSASTSRASLSALDTRTSPVPFFAPPGNSFLSETSRTRSVDSLSPSPFSSSGKVRRRAGAKTETEEARFARLQQEMEEAEREQLPAYEEAYDKMRQLVPLDIYKSDVESLQRIGLTVEAARRIFLTKVLWLITMHKDDIRKVHLADFRGKYIYDGLDIVEMRAVWHSLPAWDANAESPLERGKAEWREGLKSKLDNLAYKEAHGTLPAHLQRNAAYEQADHLHLLDPTRPVVQRFHRSASTERNPVDTPPPPGSTMQSSSLPSPYFAPTLTERSAKYLANCDASNSRGGKAGRGGPLRQESRYRTLQEEILAEEEGQYRQQGGRDEEDGDEEESTHRVDSNLDDLWEQIRQEQEEEVSSLGTDTVDNALAGQTPARLRATAASAPNSPGPSTQAPRRTPSRQFPSPLPSANGAVQGVEARARLAPFGSSPALLPTPAATTHQSVYGRTPSSAISVPTSAASSQLPRMGRYSMASSASSMSRALHDQPETPHTFVSVPSTHSYKFLSSSKPYTRQFEESPVHGLAYPSPDVTAATTAEDDSHSVHSVHSAPPASFARTPSALRHPVQTPEAEKLPYTTITPFSSTGGVPKDQVVAWLRAGDIDAVLQHGAPRGLAGVFSQPEALRLAWSFLQELLEGPNAALLDALLLLVDEGLVDVNTTDAEGQSFLLHCVQANSVAAGRELVSRGADLFLSDADHRCALSESLASDCVWLRDEFQSSGREQALLSSASPETRFRYLGFFILAGYCDEARDILATGLMTVTPEEATDLLAQCRGNFQKMKQPVETFELLESLGARLEV